MLTLYLLNVLSSKMMKFIILYFFWIYQSQDVHVCVFKNISAAVVLLGFGVLIIDYWYLSPPQKSNHIISVRLQIWRLISQWWGKLKTILCACSEVWWYKWLLKYYYTLWLENHRQVTCSDSQSVCRTLKHFKQSFKG